MLDRTIQDVPSIYNTLAIASVLSRRDQWYDGDGPMPDAVIDHVARELELGRWITRAALYGDEAVIDLQFAKIKAAFERIPGAEVWGEKCAPEDIPKLAHPGDRIQGGVPNLDWNTMTGLVRRRGGRAHRVLAGRAADRA